MVKNLLYWRQCVCQCYKRKLDSLVIRLQSRKKFKVKVGTMKPHMNIHSNCSKCCLAKLCCIMIIIYIELRKNIFVTLVIWERIREEKEKKMFLGYLIRQSSCSSKTLSSYILCYIQWAPAMVWRIKLLPQTQISPKGFSLTSGAE